MKMYCRKKTLTHEIAIVSTHCIAVMVCLQSIMVHFESGKENKLYGKSLKF